MRIIVITDGPVAGTGFSEEMKHLTFRWAQNKHEVIWLSLQHFGCPIDYYDFMFPDLPHKNAKVKIVGNWGSPKDFGSRIFPRHYAEYTPDIVLLMGDPYLLDKYAPLKKRMGFPLIHYVTLDGLPIPLKWLNKLRVPNLLVTMTNWARQEYAKLGINSATIYHGVNWEWWQTTKENKMKARQKYNVPEDCVVFINWEVNQHRKRLDALLRCWKQFKPETKNAKLLLWTDWDCRLGWDLESLIKQLDIPRETILSPKDLTGHHKLWEMAEPVTTTKEIAMLGDVYVSTTSGEGFGKCSLEAQTLGIPVIITKYSACPEVVGDAGVLVRSYYGQKGRFRWHDNVRTVEGALVNEKLFTEALYRMYDNKEERLKLGLLGKQHSKQFDYDRAVIPRWLNLFKQINPDILLMKELLQI